jgi:indole-3-glycerol phosphate synthase
VGSVDYLTPILERKRRELLRRRRHQLRVGGRAVADTYQRSAADAGNFAAADSRNARCLLALQALRRAPGGAPRVIAEIKHRSPSRGELRARERGDIEQLARAYVAGGAAAVSVLCDGPGFAGSPLDLRRAARSVAVPVLFKEFVLDELQIELARRLGAHMVLLIVCALETSRLNELVAATLAAGMAPVVEAASARELEVALASSATIVGVNARDLGSHRVDTAAAQSLLASIPVDRIAVHMSGVHTREDFLAIRRGRADAVLIGESLMRSAAPSLHLAEMLRD